MNEFIENLIIFIFGVGSTSAVAIWVFQNRNTIITFAAWFYRTFSWFSKRLEYGDVAYNIEASVNKVGKHIDQIAPDVLPYPIKITWAKTPDDLETSLRNGEIIVTLQYSPNRDRNLVVSTLAYLRKGLLPRARSYVDRDLMKATDFTVAKEVFNNAGLEMAVPYFFEHYLEPTRKETPTILEDLDRLDRINAAGFFSRVYLREIKHMGDKVYPATPNKKIWNESKEFAEYLEVISEKERGVDVPRGLMFPGTRIRTSLMFVARSQTRHLGTKIYIRRVQIDLNRGVEHMYVFARGKDNVLLAKDVVAEATDLEMLRPLKTQKYSQTVGGYDTPAICIVCALNILMQPTEESSPSELLLDILRENIPEVNEGKIEGVAAVRYPGFKSKIAVRSVYKDLDAISCCNQDNRVDSIEAMLGENVEFIPWSNDPGELIVSSLYPLEREMVVGIEIDESTKSAEVKVEGWKIKRIALGKGNKNQKLANELTGWKISIEDVSEEL